MAHCTPEHKQGAWPSTITRTELPTIMYRI